MEREQGLTFSGNVELLFQQYFIDCFIPSSVLWGLL